MFLLADLGSALRWVSRDTLHEDIPQEIQQLIQKLRDAERRGTAKP